MAKKLETGSPFIGVNDYSIEDVSAIQAFASGRDVPGHVAKRVWDYVINVLAGTYDQSYRPERPHDTAFAEGRRFVGMQMVKLSKLDPKLLKVTHGRSNADGRDPGRDPASEQSKP